MPNIPLYLLIFKNFKPLFLFHLRLFLHSLTQYSGFTHHSLSSLHFTSFYEFSFLPLLWLVMFFFSSWCFSCRFFPGIFIVSPFLYVFFSNSFTSLIYFHLFTSPLIIRYSNSFFLSFIFPIKSLAFSSLSFCWSLLSYPICFICLSAFLCILLSLRLKAPTQQH